MSNDIKEQKEKLLQLVKNAIAKDQALRDQHKIGEKFRFIRDRLNSLLQRVEEGLASIKVDTEKNPDELSPDEIIVYVYLFNAQGLVFQTWKKMVNASVFYEYSVNRPIYEDRSFVEANIRTKANRAQHAYLTIAVLKDAVIKTDSKDINNNPIIKVREGSLKIDRLLEFTHNGHSYRVSSEGELIKKPPTSQ